MMCTEVVLWKTLLIMVRQIVEGFQPGKRIFLLFRFGDLCLPFEEDTVVIGVVCWCDFYVAGWNLLG